MIPSVSVLIPTRHRISMLMNAVESIYKTAQMPEKVEVVIHAQKDDSETISQLGEVEALGPQGRVITIIGEPYGYAGDPIYFWLMANKATGVWLWHFNDDAIVEKSSNGWDSQIERSNYDNTILLPEINHLGDSRYKNDRNNPFIFIKNRWWVEMGIESFLHPTDAFVFENTRALRKWGTRFLKGVSVHHLRPKDRLMIEEKRQSYSWDEFSDVQDPKAGEI